MPEAKAGPYYDVVSKLVAAGGTVNPDWLAESERGVPIEGKIAADARMAAALKK